MVSPYFFLLSCLKKLTFFSHRPLESDDLSSCRLLTTPNLLIFPRRLSSVLSKFSHKNNFMSGVTPLEGVTRGGPPLPLLVTPLIVARCIFIFLKQMGGHRSRDEFGVSQLPDSRACVRDALACYPVKTRAS